ncbi:MAG: cation transporter [Clostridiales bacterium]|nr:cation transporter [Clostridiales bacterium]
MKSDKNILIAFLLNIFFAIFEFLGGIFTNSFAIISDSVHDIGDALSIGVSYVLEKKSKKSPDKNYTYGYLRYSVLGGVITTVILLVGSILVIYNSIGRIINPVEIRYNEMILFAIFGVIVNLIAARVTKHGHSINQRSVNLHMLEDVLGWIVVLIGAIIMKFTNISVIDSIMSIGVAIFILIHSIKNLRVILDIFLEKTPSKISIDEIEKKLMEIDNVINVHHIHVWSIDGYNNYATLHVVVNNNNLQIKQFIRDKLKEYGIGHITIEIENMEETCENIECKGNIETHTHHHHHH